jgi:hypothetical protein
VRSLWLDEALTGEEAAPPLATTSRACFGGARDQRVIGDLTRRVAVAMNPLLRSRRQHAPTSRTYGLPMASAEKLRQQDLSSAGRDQGKHENECEGGKVKAHL